MVESPLLHETNRVLSMLTRGPRVFNKARWWAELESLCVAIGAGGGRHDALEVSRELFSHGTWNPQLHLAVSGWFRRCAPSGFLLFEGEVRRQLRYRRGPLEGVGNAESVLAQDPSAGLLLSMSPAGLDRERALQHLGGELGLWALAIRATDWVPMVRKAAVPLLLQSIASASAGALRGLFLLLPTLEERLRWPSDEVAGVLGPRIAEAEVQELLLELVEASTPRLALRHARWLLRGDGATEATLRLLASNQPLVRLGALRVLRAAGESPPTRFGAPRASAAEDAFLLRWRVEEAGAASSRALLERAALHRSKRIREIALHHLRKELGEDELHRYVRCLQGAPRLLCDLLARTSGETSITDLDPLARGAASLRGAAGFHATAHRIAALRALIEVAPGPAAALAIGWLESADRSLWRAGAGALKRAARLQRGDRAFLNTIEGRLRDLATGCAEEPLARILAEVGQALGPAGAMDLHLVLLRCEASDVQLVALEHLEAFAHPWKVLPDVHGPGRWATELRQRFMEHRLALKPRVLPEGAQEILDMVAAGEPGAC